MFYFVPSTGGSTSKQFRLGSNKTTKIIERKDLHTIIMINIVFLMQRLVIFSIFRIELTVQTVVSTLCSLKAFKTKKAQAGLSD